jgi:exopolysaccharide biosynthesis WecB/TagA/CpsF family protein
MNFIFNAKLKDRVYGPTLTLHVLQKAHEEKLNVFLYGGNSDETLDKFATFVNKKFPSVTIVGKYREDKPDGNTLDAELINKLATNILLVGRGCPHQELWIANNTNHVHAVMMGVGAAFSFHAGVLQQAPTWMQNNGLEWLFRLSKEPRRLFKRYFVTNTIFLILIAKQFIQLKRLRPQLHS